MERIGVFVCHCGTNIAGTVDVAKVAEELGKVPGVVYSTHYTYMCSSAGQAMIEERIKEDKLTGVVIVGVGLPKITPERQILSNYYSEKFGDGFAFAYRFPGWQKVLQAVGRVIRTETDTGFALLIDERLAKPEYLMLYPDHWKI